MIVLYLSDINCVNHYRRNSGISDITLMILLQQKKNLMKNCMSVDLLQFGVKGDKMEPELWLKPSPLIQQFYRYKLTVIWIKWGPNDWFNFHSGFYSRRYKLNFGVKQGQSRDRRLVKSFKVIFYSLLILPTMDWDKCSLFLYYKIYFWFLTIQN